MTSKVTVPYRIGTRTYLLWTTATTAVPLTRLVHVCAVCCAQSNRAVHMICIFPLLPYSLPIPDTGRSACIDDRRLAHLWKSTSLIFGKFHRRRPSFESAHSL